MKGLLSDFLALLLTLTLAYIIWHRIFNKEGTNLIKYFLTFYELVTIDRVPCGVITSTLFRIGLRVISTSRKLVLLTIKFIRSL